MVMVQSILVLKVILNTISENIKITRLELSKKIDRSQRTVQRITNSLVDKVLLKELVIIDLGIGK